MVKSRISAVWPRYSDTMLPERASHSRSAPSRQQVDTTEEESSHCRWTMPAWEQTESKETEWCDYDPSTLSFDRACSFTATHVSLLWRKAVITPAANAGRFNRGRLVKTDGCLPGQQCAHASCFNFLLPHVGSCVSTRVSTGRTRPECLPDRPLRWEAAWKGVKQDRLCKAEKIIKM